MLNTVKDVMHTISCNAGDVARRVGDSSVDIAKRVGSGTVDMYERIGPKRTLIGLAVIAAAVGGTIVLVRYLRRRDEEMPLEAGDTEGAIDETEGNVAGVRRRRGNKRRNVAAQVSH